jgi:hypothetical protein
MKTFEEDKELKLLLKSIRLDKPAPDFTKQVMNRVFQERAMPEQVKAEPVLGKGFWIILTLFGVLMIIMFLVSQSSGAAEPQGILPAINTEKYISGYRSLFENFSSLPVSVAAISLAISLLVFLERFLSSKRAEVA